jgi:hypothetical protein
VKRGTISGRIGWIVLMVASLLAAQVAALVPTPARAADASPRDIVTTDDEAGKQAARAVDKDGSDDRSSWVEIRWERDQESPDFKTGPATVDTTLWIAHDLTSAKAIYQEQVAKNPDFPEAFYDHKGPYPLDVPKLGDEMSGLSACRDCNAKDEIFLHHRVVVRKGAAVATLYLYGSEQTAPQDLVSWYVSQVVGRVPDSVAHAPEHVGGDTSTAAPAPGGDSGQANGDQSLIGTSQPQDGGDQPQASAAPQPSTDSRAGPVQASPKDLVVKLDEAGKNAKEKSSQDGTDARGNWYEVRYERDGTGSRFHQGPVTVYSLAIVAKDVESAQKAYQDQVALNEKIPEATEKVGQKFELKEASEMGDEGDGLSACEKSCNAGGEIYVHKRLVTRVANVVSVVYVWGLSAQDGTNDAAARYFAGLVRDRVQKAQD